MTTRGTLITDFLDFVGHANDSGARDTAERAYDRVLLELWMQRAWRAFVFPTPYTFVTVANQRAYGLPPYFGRISSIDGLIRNLTTGGQLAPTTIERLQEGNPNAGTTLDTAARPAQYCLAGTMPVHTQPATAGEALEVLSTSAADTAVRVYLAGITSAGDWSTAQVTLTGVAPVAIGTWRELHECGKAYPDGTTPTTEMTSSEGTVTLRTVADQTELQRLLTQESARDVQVLTLDPTPDAVYTISVPFVRTPMRAFRDATPLPANWEPALFEALELEWKVNTGQLSRAQVPAFEQRPSFRNLVCFENAGVAQQQRHRQPYTGR